MEHSSEERLMRPEPADEEAAAPATTPHGGRRTRLAWVAVAAACLVAAALLLAHMPRSWARSARTSGADRASGALQQKFRIPNPFQSGPALFCWCIMRADSYERDILEAQRHEGVGIFQCDGQAVFSDEPVSLNGDFNTEPLGSLSSSMGGSGAMATSSWVNTENFFRAWDSLRGSNTFADYDFVVKVDPDTVIVPEFLRQYLSQHGTASGDAVYLDNCPQVDNGFYGCIEVISVAAFGGFMENFDQCRQTLAWNGWGEDLFAQQCMDSIGVMRQGAYDLVTDGNCHGTGSAPTCDAGMVAFHPLKSVDAWMGCWAQASGQQQAQAEEGPGGGNSLSDFLASIPPLPGFKKL